MTVIGIERIEKVEFSIVSKIEIPNTETNIFSVSSHLFLNIFEFKGIAIYI
jgi:hypothetical protein